MLWISRRLHLYEISNITKTIKTCTTKRNYGKKLWRLNVNYAEDLFELLNYTKKYCLHHKRLKQINIARNNILQRTRNGKIN